MTPNQDDAFRADLRAELLPRYQAEMEAKLNREIEDTLERVKKQALLERIQEAALEVDALWGEAIKAAFPVSVTPNVFVHRLPPRVDGNEECILLMTTYGSDRAETFEDNDPAAGRKGNLYYLARDGVIVFEKEILHSPGERKTSLVFTEKTHKGPSVILERLHEKLIQYLMTELSDIPVASNQLV